jgi:hypothetical protein
MLSTDSNPEDAVLLLMTKFAVVVGQGKYNSEMLADL